MTSTGDKVTIIWMLRVLLVATLCLVIPRPMAAQSPGVLHIKVTLVNAAQQPVPVPRHALLISDNPTTTAPRRVVTALDGTADVRLRPGNYTVESDQPLAFEGRAYQWTQTLDVTAGETLLELNAGNASVEAAAAATPTSAPPESGASALLMQWQDSIVALWTPTTRASGSVIDANGLVLTSQRAIGAATSVEVQLTPMLKVAGSVLVTDRERDVAIIRIAPQALASVRPVPLSCGAAPPPPPANKQEVFTIGWPLREPKGLTSGTVTRTGQDLVSDYSVGRGSVGGPVFLADGALVGITSLAGGKDPARRQDFRVVGLDKACDVVPAAATMMTDAVAPDGTHLPVEPVQPFPIDTLKEIVQRRAGSLSPYQAAAADFDIAFITPVQLYGEQYQADQANQRERGGRSRSAEPQQVLIRPLLEFEDWSDYVADFPPVLLVRITPKLVERFWTKVARGAAMTQGMALPAFKRPKTGFSRMRAFCGPAEVTPVHPFMLEHAIPERDPIYEGLYVFDPAALTPECGSVKLVLYSDKEPEKEDTLVVDPKVIEQIWQDFAPHRAALQ